MTFEDSVRWDPIAFKGRVVVRREFMLEGSRLRPGEEESVRGRWQSQ
jgi:hypothetical protein